jgi:hypothetical protein
MSLKNQALKNWLAQITVFGLLIGGVLAPGGTAQAGSEVYEVAVSFSGVQGSDFQARLSSTIKPSKFCINSGWSGSLPEGLNLPSTSSPIGVITGVPNVSGVVTGTATYMCYKGDIAENHTYRWVYNISFDFSPAPSTTIPTTTIPTTTVAERPVVIPGSATDATYSPTSMTNTIVTWKTADDAVEYRVFLNGVLECISTTSTCEISKLSGPADSVQIISVEEGGTFSEPTSAKYLARWLVSGVINFGPMKSDLDGKDVAILGEIVRLLRKHGFTQIRLNGHTDGDGSESKNLELSEERVDSTKKWLSPKLGKRYKVLEKYSGESDPKRSNKTVNEKKINRRVEIEVQ